MSLINRIKTDLKLKLFSFFLLMGIPILVMGMAFTYYNVSKNLRISIGKRFQEIAQQTADKTSFFIEREFQKLQILAGSPKLIDEINAVNVHKRISSDLLMQLKQFHANNKDEYKNIIITDKEGRLISSTNKSEIGSYKNKEEWWITAFNGLAHISNFYTVKDSYTSTGSIEYFVDISVPVVDWREVEVVGAIKATLSGEWMNRAVVNNWIGHTGHTMLITDKGIVAVCPLEFKEGDKDLHKISDSVMKNLTSMKSGWRVVEDNGHDAKGAIAGFTHLALSSDISKLGKWDWFIFVTQDPKETYIPLYTALWAQLMFGIILIGIFSISGYYAAHRIVMPIKRLKDGTEIFGRGSRDVSLPVLSDDEIGQLTQSFNNMATAIKEREAEAKNLQAQLLHTEKLAAVGELASGVAHELNNPLCGIMGFSELLLEREKDEKKKSTLAKMLNEAQRAQKIIQNLLSFVRANKQEMMPIEINMLLSETLELKEYEFRANNIILIKSLAVNLPKINGNFIQLQQVILNILNNAQMALLEANKYKKEIVIETRIKGDDNMVEISIKDNGKGILPEHLSKIFNPFFTTKEAGKGTGLGLSVSYGIIKEHNGSIYAESKYGEGATFYIELPAMT